MNLETSQRREKENTTIVSQGRYRLLPTILMFFAGACGGGSPVEKNTDLSVVEVVDSSSARGDVLVEVVEPELPAEVVEVCVPDCLERSCGEADGCDGYCYNADDCDDGIECTADFCIPEAGEGCRNVPLSHLCPGELPCRRGECDAAVGCIFVERDLEPCDDGDLCTTGDKCSAGVCSGEQLGGTECDDANLCTNDTCDPDEGCLHDPAEGACNLGTDWMVGHCELGVCVPDALLSVPCSEDADCALLDNGNPCDGAWVCSGDKLCLFSVEEVPACPTEDDTICLKNRCDPATGTCAMEPDSEGLPCTDGDVCTLQDSCVAGNCVPGIGGLACDDGNPCTADICDAATGCAHLAQEAECDDGNDCTADDFCVAAACVGEHYACDDSQPCTVDLCDGAGGCLFSEIAPGWCQIGESCVEAGTPHPQNSCLNCLPESDPVAWSPVDPGTPCDLQNGGGGCGGGDCILIECDAGFLDCAIELADGCETDGDNDPAHCGDCLTECDPGLVCNGGECLGTCPGGEEPCAGSCPDTDSDAENCGDCDVICESAEPESIGICLDAECATEPCPEGTFNLDGQPGNGCEYACGGDGSEVCDGLDNDCNGQVDEGSCDDGVQCTVDLCNPLSGCQNAPADALCDDGDVCTSHLCDLEQGCVGTNLDGPCDDGDVCTTDDACSNGACSGNSIVGCCLQDVACDDGNPCTVDSCDPVTHQCQNLADPAEGKSCDGDGVGCTIETCQAGSCASSALVECPAPEAACREVVCVSSGPLAFTCVVSNLTSQEACDDGLFCTVGDACDEAGECVPGGARDCGGEVGSCQFGICDELNDKCASAPLPDGLACDADDDGCTVYDQCEEGICQAGAAVDCQAYDQQCSYGVCVSLGPQQYECGTVPKPAETGCEDGLDCTQDDICDGAGICVGGAPVVCPGADSPCLLVSCSENAGGCVEAPAQDGTVCDDGQECTLLDLCSNGACFGTEDGCVERRANTFTQHWTYHNPLERFLVEPLGDERTVALWRGSGAILRAQIFDDELSKLRPELSLNQDWPPPTGACNPIVSRQALAGNADGNWLVVSSYKWQKFTGYSCGYTSKYCLADTNYVLSAAILDGDGEMTVPWLNLVSPTLVYQTSDKRSCGSCGCGAVIGYQPNQVALETMRAVAFSDGSFGLVHQRSGQPYKYYHLSNTLEMAAPVDLDPGTVSGEPAVCALPGDGMAVIFADDAGTLQVTYLDQNGAYVGGPVAVSATEEGHQDRPACASLQGGKLAVAFSSCADDGPCEIHAQVLKSGGAKYGQTVTASSAGDAVQAYDVSVEATADGGFALAWHQASGDAQGWSSMVRFYGADIAPKGGELRLNAQELGNQLRPLLAGIEAGVMAFFEHPVGSAQDLYVRLLSDDGVRLAGAPERDIAAAGSSPMRGTAAPTADGFAVSWDALNTDGEERGIVLRLFAADGQPDGGEQVVNQTVQGDQSDPTTAYAAASDRLLVAWTSMGLASGEDIYARLFDGAGEPVGEELVVNTKLPGDQSGSAVASLEESGFVLAWTGYSSEFAGTDVYARLLDSEGSPDGPSFLLHEGFLNDQEKPSLAATGGDEPGFVASWTHAPGSPAGVYVRRFDVSGQPLGGDEVLIDAFGQPDHSALDVAPDGTIMLCWQVADKALCQRLDEELAVVGPQFEVASGTQPSGPSVLFRTDNRVWVLQDEVGLDADGRGIRRRDLDANGNALSPFALLNMSESGDQVEGFAAHIPGGGVVTGWTGVGEPESEGLFVRVLK